VEVPWSEIVRGYEYEKGEFVVLTDKDIAKARVEATQVFAIRDFVPARSIDFAYLDEPYYLAPTGQPAAKAYALLRDALAESGRVGVGTIVLRQREHLAALEPSGKALSLITMRFAHELRSPAALDLPAAGRANKARAHPRPPAHRHPRGRVGPHALSRYVPRGAEGADRAEGQMARRSPFAVSRKPRARGEFDGLPFQKSLQSPRREAEKTGRRRTPRRAGRRTGKRAA
jgi:hypothetical protein